MRSKTPTKDPITEKILNRIPSSNLKVQDHDSGKLITETKKKKLTCETCLYQEKKFLPKGDIRKNAKLAHNKEVAALYSNGVRNFRLDFYQMDPITIVSDDRLEKLRLDHSEVVKKLLFEYKTREAFQKEMKSLLLKLEQSLRTNHNRINMLLQQETPLGEELEQVQSLNQHMIASCVSFQQQSYFDDELLQIEANTLMMENYQERTIYRLKMRVNQQNLILQRIQQSVNEPMLGMAGLLNQVSSLKQQIESLSNQVLEKEQEISKQQRTAQDVHNVLDRLKNIIKKYPSLFREQTAQNTISLREFQYDLEQLFLNYSQRKVHYDQIASLQSQNADLYQQLENEKLKNKNAGQIVKDPRLRTLIEDLSRLILSKDPNAMSYDLRELIKEIYLQNHQDIIADQERQIQRLKDEVDKIGNEYSTFRQSIVGAQIPYFDEQQYNQSLASQAKAMEKILDLYK